MHPPDGLRIGKKVVKNRTCKVNRIAPPAQIAAAQRHGLEALFLRDVRNGACRAFDGVPGPEYNAAHRNHFHGERGG
jgi:hypothetical protein